MGNLFGIIITIVHISACILLIGIVLLQQGKGADAGAAFGGGSNNTFFGASGAGTFITRTTTVIALIFMCTSLILARGMTQVSTSPIEGSSLGTLPEAIKEEVPTPSTKAETTTTDTTTSTDNNNKAAQTQPAQAPVAEQTLPKTQTVPSGENPMPAAEPIAPSPVQ